ncbi:MAG: hypothetical protein IPL74_13755 [Bacteroidetes bacterium]|nr:hypothetical protein [Bacteroidota bacterium]
MIERTLTEPAVVAKFTVTALDVVFKLVEVEVTTPLLIVAPVGNYPCITCSCAYRSN